MLPERLLPILEQRGQVNRRPMGDRSDEAFAAGGSEDQGTREGNEMVWLPEVVNRQNFQVDIRNTVSQKAAATHKD